MKSLSMKRWLIPILAVTMLYAVACFVRYYTLPPEVQAQTNTFCAANLACTVSAAWSFTAASTASQWNGSLAVGGAITSWAGSDIIAQIATAVASAPAAPSVTKIYVLPPTGGGCYSASSTITLNTVGKFITFEGVGSGTSFNGSAFGGVCINYTPTTATSMFTVDFCPAAGCGVEYTFMKNMILINNNCTTAGGCGSSANAITIGNTNGGWGHAQLDTVTIFGFGTGINNTNTSTSGWGHTLKEVTISDNTTGWNEGVSGENVTCNHAKFLTNGTGILSTSNITSSGCSFDGNTVTAVNLNYTGTSSPAISQFINGTHFENTGCTVAPLGQFITGNGNWTIEGGELADDCTSGTNAQFLNANGGVFSVVDTEFIHNGADTITTWVQAGASVRGFIQAKLFSAVTETTVAGTLTNVTDTSYNITNSHATRLWTMEPQIKVPFGIGDASFTPASTVGLHLRMSGTNFDMLRFDDTANAHIMDVGPAIGAPGFFSFRDITNAVQALQYTFSTKAWNIPVAASGGLSVGAGLVTPLASNTALQIFNTTTTCTTGASVGATCTTAAISLPVAEADTAYRVTCVAKPALTAVPVVISTTNSSASQFTITIAALTAVAASAASYDCVAGHN